MASTSTARAALQVTASTILWAISHIWNCDIAAGTGIYVKSSTGRGGYIKDVKVYNCYASTIAVAFGYCFNNDGDLAPCVPEISDLSFEDLTLTGIGKFTGEHERVEPETAISIIGLDEKCAIKRVSLKNIALKYRQMIPNQFMKLNHVEDVSLENIICLGEI